MGKLFKSTATLNQVVIPPFSFIKRKTWLISLGIVFVLLIAGVGIVYGQNKEITLVIDGQPKKIETTSKDLQTLLVEQKIPFKQEDKLSIPLQSRIKNGQTIRLDHANEIVINISGKTTKVYTTVKTVAEVLQQQKVTLGEWDKISPALQTQITPNTEIVITKVDRKVVQSEEVIPFGYVRKADSALAKGKEKVMTQGKNGKVIKFFEVTYENGQEKDKKLVKQNIVQPKADQIVAYGTRVENPVVSRGGASFRSRKTLTNVAITQYSSGTYTYLGTRATPGRTIAVDPNIIPLGWWVYIEGFGFRRAEDIGGAVKGNIIDIFVDSNRAAISYGKRYGYKVYIIGPNRPN